MSIHSATDYPSGAELAADVCVIGAGAAGITLARELASGGRSVLLLEGGEMGYTGRSQALYAGETEGTIFSEEHSGYLLSSRLRYFGGSTNHWSGFCRPLDPIDFEVRDWVPGSGWPIGPADLEPYNERAREVLFVSPFPQFRPQPPHREQEYVVPLERGFETTFFHIRPMHFGRRYGKEIENADRIRLVVGANATGIRVNADASHVERVELRTFDGRHLSARAAAIVLAAGGIENARLLLVSNDVVAAGVGNQHDVVGRYFMEHPMLTVGQLALTGGRRPLRIYDNHFIGPRGQRRMGAIRPTEALQREHRLLNSSMRLKPVSEQEMPELSRAMVDLSADTSDGERKPGYVPMLLVMTEQCPIAESRVELLGERDELGVPKVRLNWLLGEQTARSIRVSAELLARALGAELRGRAHLSVSETAPWNDAYPADHHMGTTRMSEDPHEGVVDPHCRVHGIENLFVAGSSVFPTGGASTPTLTIVALAIRLADRLLEVLSL